MHFNAIRKLSAAVIAALGLGLGTHAAAFTSDDASTHTAPAAVMDSSSDTSTTDSGWSDESFAADDTSAMASSDDQAQTLVEGQLYTDGENLYSVQNGQWYVWIPVAYQIVENDGTAGASPTAMTDASSAADSDSNAAAGAAYLVVLLEPQDDASATPVIYYFR